MDAELSVMLVERDWAALVAQCSRLHLGQPRRVDLDVFITVPVEHANVQFTAVLECDEYDALAPLLDFVDPEDPALRGAPYWPKFTDAPMNSVAIGTRTVPILCTPGTRGYHLHQSHNTERFERTAWPLARSATLLWRLTHEMGTYERRGV